MRIHKKGWRHAEKKAHHTPNSNSLPRGGNTDKACFSAVRGKAAEARYPSPPTVTPNSLKFHPQSAVSKGNTPPERAKTLHFLDQAAHFQALAERHGLSQREIAAAYHLSQSAVANKLRILHLTPEERQKIRENGLSERHARALLSLKEPFLRTQLLQSILDAGLNVADTEALVERLRQEAPHPEAVEAPKTSTEPPQAALLCGASGDTEPPKNPVFQRTVGMQTAVGGILAALEAELTAYSRVSGLDLGGLTEENGLTLTLKLAK